MTLALDIGFSTSSKGAADLHVFLAAAGEGGSVDVAGDAGPLLEKAIKAGAFTAKMLSTLDIIVPTGMEVDRVLLVGVGDPRAITTDGWLKVGGAIASNLKKAAKVFVHADMPGFDTDASAIADLALGTLLRTYRFDRYKTKKDESDEQPKRPKVTIVTRRAAAAKAAFAGSEAVASGVALARDLVNEPANMMGPVEMAAQCRELEALGVKVEILAEKEMKKLGMGALLGVAQGSPRGARLVVMQWSGGKAKDRPVAFIGKGVSFDTGGNSMKPAAGMEDMKGDMGGAAAVIGAMHVLARRKAKANVVGIVGLVENSVDGNAQRPGDIVTSMSGQTIEVLNTDAEGRLVLCDALWYCNGRFAPKFMVNLATLTGAIMVALGQYHAGLFSNDDELAGQLTEAGLATAEKLWRMPMGPEYDKLLDSKNADMKNIGGRFGGAITAAQFLRRFVKDTPWAHLDIAGTAMNAPPSEYSISWGSGFGVRLLDRLVKDNYEG
ncbi:leucyl aminopeptidase [Mesorhizobium australicum]|uniref:Probable cytosol aminopeptidase n=1 Tax=Mesorhizobium australicum TaxID=536018 RepID=A0A1X7P1M2_9HYPH|nr:leucyl aminopeptidase [Mesorhizobium australicum]SMH44044.1 leucyl aminopeptidase [Mesorhizobium australicum]